MQPELFVPPTGHPLRPYVAAIFRLRARDEYSRELILPRATASVMFSLADPLGSGGSAYGGATVELRTSRVSGVRSAPVAVWPTGDVYILGVSLRAEGCAELLPVPLGELANASVDGDALLPELAPVRERLGEAAAFGEQCAVLTGWLLGRLRPDARAAAVRWACRALRRDPGEGAVARVARELAITPRHLRRLMVERVGLGPAAYVRLRRFGDALPLIHRGRTLSEVAHAAGYYDQPHFCRDFRLFAGMTPQEYLRVRGPVPGNVFST